MAPLAFLLPFAFFPVPVPVLLPPPPAGALGLGGTLGLRGLRATLGEGAAALDSSVKDGCGSSGASRARLLSGPDRAEDEDALEEVDEICGEGPLSFLDFFVAFFLVLPVPDGVGGRLGNAAEGADPDGEAAGDARRSGGVRSGLFCCCCCGEPRRATPRGDAGGASAMARLESAANMSCCSARTRTAAGSTGPPWPARPATERLPPRDRLELGPRPEGGAAAGGASAATPDGGGLIIIPAPAASAGGRRATARPGIENRERDGPQRTAPSLPCDGGKEVRSFFGACFLVSVCGMSDLKVTNRRNRRGLFIYG